MTEGLFGHKKTQSSWQQCLTFSTVWRGQHHQCWAGFEAHLNTVYHSTCRSPWREDKWHPSTPPRSQTPPFCPALEPSVPAAQSGTFRQRLKVTRAVTGPHDWRSPVELTLGEVGYQRPKVHQNFFSWNTCIQKGHKIIKMCIKIIQLNR